MELDCCLTLRREHEAKSTTASGFNCIFPFLPFFVQVGEVEGQPGKSGVFPISFVRVLSD